MGVTGLWRLLEPVGRSISLESLEGKTLAIDASIWLTQFIKAMRDDEGKLVKNAHLVGTLRRVLKLMHFRIKPIFVFDGETPTLKINTMRKRRMLHLQNEGNLKKTAAQILMNQMKQRILVPASPPPPTNFVETFHLLESGVNSKDCAVSPTESKVNDKDYLACAHWPPQGARVRFNLQDKSVQFGTITDDDIHYRTTKARGSVVILFKDGELVEVSYPSENIDVIEPCTICHPPSESTQDAPHKDEKAIRSKKRKLGTKSGRASPPRSRTRQGRLYDSDSESLGGSSSASDSEWVLPASGDIDITALSRYSPTVALPLTCP